MPKATRTMPDQAYLREAFRYNRKTGQLTWRRRPREHFKNTQAWNAWNTKYAGKSAGALWGDRWSIRLDGVIYRRARIIWKLTFGTDPIEVDHRDLNKSNDRLSNLREATRSQQQANTRRSRRNTSGVKGVSRNPDGTKWVSHIEVRGTVLCLGTFASRATAFAAYCEAAKKHFGAFWNPG
jgi:hypothetical protein